MGELYAEYVLAGRVSYEDAVYIFYLKFPTKAKSLLNVMNTVIRAEGRKDLILKASQITEIKERAEADRVAQA